MAVIAVERGDRVTHRSDNIPTTSFGTVAATFLDLEDRPCAAVLWDGGFFGVSRLKWLVKL